jgi:glycosyltransferase involved in cell wall biosynthesis
VKPRVLYVARTRYRLPLSETLARRFDALSGELDWRVLGTARGGEPVDDGRFRLVGSFPVAALDGLAFYAALPFRVRRELRRFRPDAVVVQGTTDGALTLAARRLAGVRPPVVLDVHGDWRHDTRVYGSSLRRLLSPLADRLADSVLRRADGIRTVSGFTTGLVREAGREPTATFPAYMDLEPFTRTPPAPLPETPTVLFVGVLERYKGVDVLAEAWPRVAERVPGSRLHVVGRGPQQPVVEQLAATGDGRVTWTPELPTEGVAAALDDATLLVLPSRREGMGRVVVEAFCRGRSVVGSDTGGIPDLVAHDRSGLLVPEGDADALADALTAVLSERELAERLGSGAHAAAVAWTATPEEFATRMRALVDAVIGP